ncbi:MAG TPA: DUF1328 family protein [Tepidisphaeraceae bacterium]|nr:DUF1328 family protein [Tepidisphaeraceae bacterium]
MISVANTLASFALGQTVGHSALGTMFWLAIAFFIIALVAWAMGSGGVAGMSAGIGRMLLFVFLILAVLFIVLNFTMGSRY